MFGFTYLVQRYGPKRGQMVRENAVLPAAGLKIGLLLYLFALIHVVAGLGVWMNGGMWQIAAIAVSMGLFYVALAHALRLSKVFSRFVPKPASE